MSLSSEESRRLAAIEHDLSHDCPGLSRALSAGRLPPDRLRRVARWVLLAAVVTLVVGVGIQNGPVCAGGWLGLVASGLVLCARYLDLGRTVAPDRRAGAR